MPSNSTNPELESNASDESRPMRLLLLTTELRPGGAEKCLVNLACSLNPNQFRPLVVSIKSRPESQECKLIKRLEGQNIPTYFLDCDSKWSMWTAAKKLSQLLKKHEIDVVQSFLIHANLLAGFVLRKFPEIRFFTGIRVADPSKFRHRIEKWLTRRAEKMICVSSQVKEFAKTEMGLPEGKLTSIPNGVEAAELDPSFSLASIGIDTPYVLFVGRMEEQKGLVRFFDEFPQRDQSLPPFELVMVGDGTLRSQLEKRASKLQRRCHWLGWQESPQNLMHHASCIILPSLWEGMPNVLLEAMSQAKPFVAFGVDGVQEINVEDRRQIIESANYDQFFSFLSELLTNQQLAKQIGLQNHKIADENFSIKKMIAKYEGLYLGCPDSPSA